MQSLEERYTCQYPGCGKSFARKEHLGRHSRSHKGTERYICQLCSREFTRRFGLQFKSKYDPRTDILCYSDSLQRHFTRHGSSVISRPSGRSKHACVACHASKIKCDGSNPCSACMKKDPNGCKYDLSEYQLSPADSGQPDERVSLDAPESSANSDVEMRISSSAGLTTDRREVVDFDLQRPPGTAPRATAGAPGAGEVEPVDWFRMKIQKDSSSTAEKEHVVKVSQCNFVPIYKELYPLPEEIWQEYIDLYFAHFHHRWTLTHSPSLEVKSHVPIILSSIKMIGAWITGTKDGKWLAMAMHERIVAQLTPQLV